MIPHTGVIWKLLQPCIIDEDRDKSLFTIMNETGCKTMNAMMETDENQKREEGLEKEKRSVGRRIRVNGMPESFL